jgi:hypothetical protein
LLVAVRPSILQMNAAVGVWFEDSVCSAARKVPMPAWRAAAAGLARLGLSRRSRHKENERNERGEEDEREHKGSKRERREAERGAGEEQAKSVLARRHGMKGTGGRDVNARGGRQPGQRRGLVIATEK